jgi:formyl-CoA transferase
MRDVLITKPSDYWMQALTEAGVPVALVGRIDELPNDPQVVANHMAIQPTDEVGMPSVIKHPINVEGLHTRAAGPAPELGQHSEEILAELGYRAQDIAQMKEQGII